MESTKIETDKPTNICDGSYFLLSPIKWPEKYLYIQNNGEGNGRGWQGDPGPQGHFQFHKTKEGHYWIVTKQWPLHFVYMQADKTGNVRTWDGLPGEQGEFIIKKVEHPTADNIFYISTKKWPEKYMYM